MQERFDTEGMVILDSTSTNIWMVSEFPPIVIEYDFENKVEARRFVLPLDKFDPPIDRANGLEGITFLPDPSAPSGGIFLVANSISGDIYKFRIPATSTGPAEYIGKFATSLKQPITGLDYHVPNKLLYVLYGTIDEP